jgi:hypothetical protein
VLLSCVLCLLAACGATRLSRCVLSWGLGTVRVVVHQQDMFTALPATGLALHWVTVAEA